ncbi:hypothetical protein BGW42_002804 [Actinomortierella wolfii]|nr:hypothetical protein BGW42_002804 [Actinomortierella wolfii]
MKELCYSFAVVAKQQAEKQGRLYKVIVVFKDGTPNEEIEKAIKDVEAQGKCGKIGHRYDSALLGFSAELPDDSVQSLTLHPQLEYIEPDGEVTAYTRSLLTGK